jgi:putative cell wall-binding protein
LSRRAALTGLLAAGTVMALPAARAHASSDSIAGVLRDRINHHRQQHGLAPLPEDHHLSTVSTGWSAHMAAAGGLSHNPDRDAQYGWSVERSGEIVAYVGDSRLTPDQMAHRIVENWMASSDHRAVILGSSWTDLGVGWWMSSGGRLYATANTIRAELPASAAEALSLSVSTLPGASAPRMVIARSDVAVDALAGASLAGGDSPLLLARSNQPLAGCLLAEISRVATPQTLVYLVGGAIHPLAEQQVRETGAIPVRLAGSTRFETAALVAHETVAVRRETLRFHLVGADAWADAVAIAGQSAYHAHPILLLERDGVPPATQGLLNAFPQAERLVIGGPNTVSDAVVDRLQARRIHGADRAGTGAEVMRQLWVVQSAAVNQHLVVTPGWTADGWATALAHTTISARHAAPLLFSADVAPPPVRDVLQQTGYSRATAATVRFARAVPAPAQLEIRALTGN